MTTIRTLLVAASVLVLGACDFKVTNPGPVSDAALDDPGAWDALIRGVQYNHSRATSIAAYYSAVAAKEFSTAGRVIATKLPLNFGQLDVDDMSGNIWTWAQGARWQAEDGVRRLKAALGDGPFAAHAQGARLLMYAALVNRMMGECFCEAVRDGGPTEPHTVYLTAAQTYATDAINNTGASTAIRQAAYAIRASARLYLGNFAGAAADAGQVPANFVAVTAPFDQAVQNIVVESNDAAVGGSFRATTAWRTFFESYFRTSGDLRVRWDTVGVNGVARDGEFTGIKWLYQRKYVPTGTVSDRASPIRVISQREMRLIEAEVLLRGGDFNGANAILTALRTGQAVRAGSPALTAWPVTNVQQGWDALKKERSIELWLEARTMGDLRRWIADGTYQANFTIEPNRGGILGSENDVSDRIRLCFPITRAERITNPNIEDDPGPTVLTRVDPKSPIYSGVPAVW
jgi:hypothetical protein